MKDRSIASVAASYDRVAQRRWATGSPGTRRSTPPTRTAGRPPSRLKNRETESENGGLRQENEFLKKQPTGLRRNVRDRALRDRDREEGYYPVSSMCRCAGVSRSGYYSGRDRPESITKVRRQELRIMIKDAFEGS